MMSMPTPQMRRCEQGFSLVELIVVTLVISILASVAIARLSSSLSSRRLLAASRRIASDLAYARTTAKDLGRSVQVQFITGGTTYSMPTVQDPNGGPSYSVDLQQTPYPVTIASADFGGDATVVFDLYGYANSGGTISLTEGVQSSSIVLHPISGIAEVAP